MIFEDAMMSTPSVLLKQSYATLFGVCLVLEICHRIPVKHGSLTQSKLYAKHAQRERKERRIARGIAMMFFAFHASIRKKSTDSRTRRPCHEKIHRSDAQTIRRSLHPDGQRSVLFLHLVPAPSRRAKIRYGGRHNDYGGLREGLHHGLSHLFSAPHPYE